MAPDDEQAFFGAGLDLKDYFHTLRIDEDLSSVFGLMPIRGRELPSELRLALGPSLDSIKFPCLATLPMGFSWAMYGAQRAREFSVDSCKLQGRRLHDRCDPVHLDTELRLC